MNNLKKIVCIFVCIFYCAFITAITSSSEKYQFYFLAHYNQLEKNSNQAKRYYDYLLKNHNTAHIYSGLLFHLSQTEQFETILKLIPSIEAHKKNDVQTDMIIINAFQALNKTNEAINRLTALSKNHPENPEINFYAASMHAENNRFSQALECIDTYLQNAINTSKNFIFYFLKAQIYSRVGNYQLATINVKKCLELSPGFDQGWLLLGLINELSGNLEEAVHNYQSTLKLLGPNPLLERQIMQLQVRQQMMNQSGNQLFKEALEAYTAKEYQKALQIISADPQKETHVPTCLLTIEILCKINKVDEALLYLQKKIETDFTNDTWYRTAHLLYKAGVPSSRTLTLFSSVEKKDSSLVLPLLYKADIYLRLQDTKNAIVYLTKAAEKAHDTLVKTRVLYQLSALYFENKEWNKMLTTLLEGKKLNQDYPPLLNLLAYYYATKGNNIQEAESLITAVLKKDKNPHFIETRALILYKQKKYDEAYKLLTALTKKMPQDASVLYHLAKTMHKKGDTKAAYAMLQQAINFCSISNDKTKYQKCLQQWNSLK